MHTMIERMSTVEDHLADVAASLVRLNAANERMEARHERIQTENEQLERSSKRLDRQLGALANKQGRLVEDIMSPGISRVFRRMFGRRRIELTLERLTVADRRDPGRTREFDSIVIASDLVLVCETKSTLRPDDIPNFMQGLAEIREYLPQANGRDVVGALASFRIDPSLITAGERKGLLMFGLGTGLVRILNTKGFDPHRF
ncbi:MAG: hypothetical protein IT182_03175 [Acidobacteria bacterium]|nr:hypothetical protein [Acidobacteriota bacterium]